MSDWVTLDVGGRLFKTFKSTLLTDTGSIFYTMLDDPSWEPHRSEEGHIVVDADPDMFAVVLNYLRTNKVIIPPGVPKAGVLATARYLQVQGVLDWYEREKCQVTYSWGSGSCGELGTWNRQDVASPVEVKLVPHGRRVVQVALGAQYSCLLTNEGVVYSFGNGDWGQLGVQTSSPDAVATPTPVESLLSSKVECIGSGYAYAMAVTDNHRVYFWGNNNHGQSGLGPDYFGPSFRKIEFPTRIALLDEHEICQVSCGSFFVLALSKSGDIWAWGLIDCLGLGTVDEVRAAWPDDVADSVSKEKRATLLSPHRIASFTPDTRVVHIAAGQWHSCSLTESGSVYSWGVGYQGRLGHGNKEPCWVPREVTGCLEKYQIIDISCGSFHTVALSKCGRVFCWGDNANGQCGVTGMESVLDPTQVHSLSLLGGGIARSISSGRQHTSVVISGPHNHEIPNAPGIQNHGQVYIFGESKIASNMASAAPPSPLRDGTGFVQMRSTRSPQLPRLVRGMEGSNVISVVSGLYHSVALAEAIPKGFEDF